MVFAAGWAKGSGCFKQLKLMRKYTRHRALKKYPQGLTRYGNWYKDSLDMAPNGVAAPDYTL